MCIPAWCEAIVTAFQPMEVKTKGDSGSAARGDSFYGQLLNI